jgi:hypothetical protein
VNVKDDACKKYEEICKKFKEGKFVNLNFMEMENLNQENASWKKI